MSTQTPRLKSTMTVAAAAASLTTALAGQANAASLNTDLVQNGDFEATSSVDTTPPITWAYFDSSWTGGTFTSPSANVTYGYNYAVGYDNRSGNFVPPGNGAAAEDDFYWSMNGWDEEAFQQIDLSTGDTAAAIAAGLGQYNIGAYFTGYGSDLDSGRMTLDFLDGSDSVIGSVIFDDPTNQEWSLIGGTGAIPVGTASAVITLGKNPSSGASGGPDIYVDNVTFTVSEVPEPSSLALLGLGGLLIARRRRG